MKSTINIHGTLERPLKCSGKEDATQYLDRLFDASGFKVRYYDAGVKYYNGSILLIYHVAITNGDTVTLYFDPTSSSQYDQIPEGFMLYDDILDVKSFSVFELYEKIFRDLQIDVESLNFFDVWHSVGMQLDLIRSNIQSQLDSNDSTSKSEQDLKSVFFYMKGVNNQNPLKLGGLMDVYAFFKGLNFNITQIDFSPLNFKTNVLRVKLLNHHNHNSINFWIEIAQTPDETPVYHLLKRYCYNDDEIIKILTLLNSKVHANPNSVAYTLASFNLKRKLLFAHFNNRVLLKKYPAEIQAIANEAKSFLLYKEQLFKLYLLANNDHEKARIFVENWNIKHEFARSVEAQLLRIGTYTLTSIIKKLAYDQEHQMVYEKQSELANQIYLIINQFNRS